MTIRQTTELTLNAKKHNRNSFVLKASVLYEKNIQDERIRDSILGTETTWPEETPDSFCL